MKSFDMSRWIGNRTFYRRVMLLLIPMVIQQGITNLVNLLDNIMVGQLGTEPISGVAVSNQLIFIFNLMVFGILAGGSIFGAQYYGKGDREGFHETFRFRLLASIILVAAGWSLLHFRGERLIIMYLGSDEEAATIHYAVQYLNMICWQLLPFALVQSLGGALKDCGEAKIPMQASVLAICTNLILNYLLIYGKFGFPEMGIVGAALATVIARYLELIFLVVRVWRNLLRLPFMQNIFGSLRISGRVAGKILITGSPLFLNETLWSVGITMTNSCYATRGIEVVAATNISQTVWNLFGIVLMATGNAIGILAGQHLGADDFEGAKDTVRKMMVLAVGVNIGIGLLIILVSPVIPLIYNTEPEVRRLATRLLIVCGCMLPVSAYVNGAYFTLRSGGKTVITFFFDCGFIWICSLPAAWFLCYHTELPILMIYLTVQLLDIIKVVIGTILMKSGIWINNVLPEEG